MPVPCPRRRPEKAQRGYPGGGSQERSAGLSAASFQTPFRGLGARCGQQCPPGEWGGSAQCPSALQVEGAFVQGMGLFTLEELHYSPEGSLHTRGPSTYKIPAFGSIPTNFRVSLLRDCPNKKAIYASKVLLPWVWPPSCLHRGNPRVVTGPALWVCTGPTRSRGPGFGGGGGGAGGPA